jgi:hypothetical protein
MKRFSLSRPGAGARRIRFIPRLEILEDRLPPGDVVCGVLLGWAEVAAPDGPPLAIDACDGLSNQAKRLADLCGTDGLAALTKVDRAAEPAGGAAPNAGPSTGTQRGLPDPAGAQGAPASRLVAEGQANAASSASVFVIAPPGPGIPTPAFAAVAGAIVQHPPSALATSTSQPSSRTPAVDRTQVMSRLNGTGLSFERNVGQTASRVDYLARTGGGTVFLTPTAAVFAMQKAPSVDPSTVAGMPSPKLATPSSDGGVAVYMQIIGANPAARPVGQDELPGKVNYFIGNNPAQWHTDIPTFGRVEYPNVLAGIDLVYYGGPDGLEYDFTVRPGADAHAIALKFDGADAAALDAQGDLVVHTAVGDLVQHAPVLYQGADGQRQPVSGRFALDSGLVRFDVGPYDRTRPLVIDPVLSYSTFLGGYGDDLATGVVVDDSGSAYVTGRTSSPNFPLVNPAQGTIGGYYDAFVAKLNPAGTALVYATYLGGKNYDTGLGVAVSGKGAAYVTGWTTSNDFPLTPGAVQRTIGGGSCDGDSFCADAFVTKLSPDGATLAYSTYLGGKRTEFGSAVAVDAAGSAYVTGITNSLNFPTQNPLQGYGGGGTCQDNNDYHYCFDAYVAKLNPTGSALVYSTYLGGNKDEGDAPELGGIAVDAAGQAYVTGQTSSANFPILHAVQPTFGGGFCDAFVTKLRADGTRLIYSTFLGGTQGEYGEGIGIDSAGSAYVAGTTGSVDFPLYQPYQASYHGDVDAFVTKLSADGTAFGYSTYLGGTRGDYGFAVAVDQSGSAVVAGTTFSADFPTASPIQPLLAGQDDGFITRFTPQGTALAFSTYLGGSGYDGIAGVRVDGLGNIYVASGTSSPDFPTVHPIQGYGGGSQDAFVAKISRLGRATAVAHGIP